MKTMLKLKFGVSILALMVSAGVMAQSVQEGRRMLHMQRHHAAKKILQQLAHRLSLKLVLSKML
jgi:hypothetical protein